MLQNVATFHSVCPNRRFSPPEALNNRLLPLRPLPRRPSAAAAPGPSDVASAAGHLPPIDAGVPVPGYASAPRSNTFETTVIEDFFGADPAARLVLLAELRESLHLFSDVRMPGPVFGRNCSEMTSPQLAKLAPQLFSALTGPEALAVLERRTGLFLAPFPSTDELSIRANLYNEAGDGISPHFDGNPFIVRW